jgi:acetoin utilization protein AcuB
MEIRVDEYTSPVLVKISADKNLDEALEMMQENGVRHLPVEHNSKIVGIVSERDLMAFMGKDWTSMVKIEDIMNINVLSVYGSENLGEVALQLSSQKVGSALVLDESGEIYGIFTTTDALNALVEILYPAANKKSEFKEL